MEEIPPRQLNRCGAVEEKQQAEENKPVITTFTGTFSLT